MLWLYIDLMPQLQAEDSLLRIAELSVAFGTMPKRDRRNMMRFLIKLANSSEDKRPKLSKENAEAVFASMGIKVCKANT